MAKNKQKFNSRDSKTRGTQLKEGLKTAGEIAIEATKTLTAIGGAFLAYKQLTGKGK